jgi:hypothetical protein
MIFTHPGSRIQKQQQKREVKKKFCHTLLCSHKFHKIVNYFSFEQWWANLDQAPKDLDKTIFRDLSPTPKP